MNYNEQQAFLTKYRMASIAALSLVVALELAHYFTAQTRAFSQVVINSLLTGALGYALVYLPKYLHFTIEPEKKLFWSVRIRWILAACLLLIGLLSANQREQYQLLLIAVVLLITFNFAVLRWLKWQRRAGRAGSAGWHKQVDLVVGFVYTLGDACALAMIFNAFSPNAIVRVLLCALAAHLAIQLNMLLAILIFGGLLFAPPLPALLLYLVLVAASVGLTRATRKRNQENREQTIGELVKFTAKPRQIIEELLATSTGKLAADWHQKKPQGKAAVEAWYCDNSPYYIYDLAQYHLAYKHIVFTLDVMKLSRGRVLDYGAGIGDLSLALAARGMTVTYFDVEGQSKQYAGWQARQRQLKLNFASHHHEINQQKFDTIIVLDVLEHLFEPEQTLEFLLARLADGGVLIASAYFGATAAHPMHFDHKMDVARFLAEHGLSDAKSLSLRLFGSEAMRRGAMFIYHKRGMSNADAIAHQPA